MSEDCSVCLTKLDEKATDPIDVPWIIKCGHRFHKECIVHVYKTTKNKYTEDCLDPLQPKCPICRIRIKMADLPRGFIKPKPVINPKNIIADPEDGGRPIRLSRVKELINKQRILDLIDQLASKRRKPEEKVSSQTSSTSQLPSSQVYDWSPRFFDDLTNDIPSQASQPRKSPNHETMLQRHIAMAQQLLIGIDEAPKNINSDDTDQSQMPTCSSNITQSSDFRVSQPQVYQLDDVSDYEEDVDEDEMDLPTPVVIRDVWARGRHLHYILVWSDGYESLNKLWEMQEFAPGILKAYQKESNRKASAKYRAKQRLLKSNADYH